MPSVAQEEPILSSIKKRRRNEDDTGTPILVQLYASPPTLSRSSASPASPSSHPHFHTSGFASASPRKILPLAKRTRLDDDAFLDLDHHHSSSPFIHRPHPSSPSRHTKQPTLSRSPSAGTAPHLTATHSPDALQSTTANKPTKLLAAKISAPCHICHRRPTKKSIEQDDFGDCQACGERACFICIRQCAGWRENEASWVDEQGREHGHRRIVCSRCCVERGVDGDVVCLGCLPFVEG